MSPLVAFHGFTGGPESFAGLDLPFALLPYSAGHGPLPYPQSSSFEQEVERLIGVLRAQTVPVRLVGYSMGARLALAVGICAPELLSELELIGVNPGIEREQERIARREWEQTWIKVLREEGVATFESKWSSLPLFQSQTSVGEEERARQKTLRLSHAAEGLAHSLSVVGLGAMPNLWPRLAELRVPTRCIIGAEDEKFREIGSKMAHKSRLIECCVVANVGHNPLLEAPEELAQLLQSPTKNR